MSRPTTTFIGAAAWAAAGGLSDAGATDGGLAGAAAGPSGGGLVSPACCANSWPLSSSATAKPKDALFMLFSPVDPRLIVRTEALADERRLPADDAFKQDQLGIGVVDHRRLHHHLRRAGRHDVARRLMVPDRKSTRLNSSHSQISY